MKVAPWLLALAAAVALPGAWAEEAEEAAAADAATDSDVVVLTEKTHDDFIAKNKLTLVEYYAPWCGHCKALAPHFDEAAATLKGLPTPISIAKVDCTVEKAPCAAAGVGGYPTLKVYTDGKAADYAGDRTAESIVSTLKKLTMPAVSKLTADEAADFADSDRVVVIAYAKEDSPEAKALEEVAKLRRTKYTFGLVTAKAGEEAFPSIVLYKKFDERKDVYAGAVKASALMSFVDEHAVALMDDIGPDNFQMYMDRNLPVAFLFVDATNRDTYGPLVEPLAKQYKGKMSFVYIDATKYGGYSKNLGLEESWPAFAIQIPHKTEKFPFTGTITSDTIAEYVADFLAGKVKPVFKSAPVPKEGFKPGMVQVVVGTNFAEVVNNPEHDVVMELYAPWCGHCKKLSPIYDELAAALKGHPKIVIAKMDATENDLPADTPYQVQGFPTIKFYPAGAQKAKVLEYEGDRTVAGFMAFLKKSATNGKGIVVPAAAEPEVAEAAEAEAEGKEEL